MFKRFSFFLIIFFFVFSFTNSYAYQGPKQRIAVTKFENKVQGVYGNWNLGSGFAEMLTTELMKSERFIVVERQALTDVLGEQELGQAGIIRKETAAKVGQVLGAQIIVRGVVSEFDMQKSGGGGGIGIGGFRLGLKGGKAHVAVDIRLIDASTGQVLHSHNAAGTASSSGIGIGVTSGDVDFTSSGFQKTPLGLATRQAIHDVIEFIISKMEDMPVTAKIIKISGNKVYLNAGATMNIQPGDKFLAYSKGESMIDPDTGLNLGSEDTLVGTVEVTDVKDKYSIGLLEAGSGTLKRGDILKFQ
jgi:curli biogenesis system outer membrane secretion channel CsgG